MHLFTRISFDPDKLRRQKRKFFLLAAALLLCALASFARFLSNDAQALLAVSLFRLYPALSERSPALKILLLAGALAAGALHFAPSAAPSGVTALYLGTAGLCAVFEWRRLHELTGAAWLLLLGMGDIALAASLEFSAASALHGHAIALHLLLHGLASAVLSSGFGRLERIMRASLRPRKTPQQEEENPFVEAD